jgi:hypothetical protein
MFQTDQSWEIIRNSTVLRALLRQPGVRQYPLVEISGDAPILHVDVLADCSDDSCSLMTRYLCVSAAVALDLLLNEEVTDGSVSVQIRSPNDSKFRIERITGFYCAAKESGEHELLYRCESGDVYTDGTGIKAQVDIQELNCLWMSTKMG